MASPWAKITMPELTNLEDIMSEEVAKDLQAKENLKYAEAVGALNGENQDDIPETVPIMEGDDSDAVIARMLQKQFDEEYDDMLKRTEDKYNGTSKVSISFSNYRRKPQNLGLYNF